MSQLLRARPGHYLLLILVWALLCLVNLGAPSLWDIDEGNNATCAREMYERGDWIVPTFNFHPHLPHYALTTNDDKAIRLLAQQPVDTSHPHPFIEAGNTAFNMFLWMPPTNERPGDILLADSTIFTTLFGGDESLDRFWKNLATK